MLQRKSSAFLVPVLFALSCGVPFTSTSSSSSGSTGSSVSHGSTESTTGSGMGGDGGAGSAASSASTMSTSSVGGGGAATTGTGGDTTSSGGSTSASTGTGGDCGSNKKLCDGNCVPTDDPSMGCAEASCDPCELDGASPKCSSGVCAISACDSGYKDCDSLDSTGCEIHTDEDVDNCGACDHVCDVPNAVPSCVGGVCGVGTCDSGYKDCDSSMSNGCETHTDADVNNCGTCNHVCSLPHATAACTAGACAVQDCDPGYKDCNGNPANGCEIHILTDLANCGACNNACKNTTQAFCGTGKCSGPSGEVSQIEQWLCVSGLTSPSSSYYVGFGGVISGAPANDPVNNPFGASVNTVTSDIQNYFCLPLKTPPTGTTVNVVAGFHVNTASGTSVFSCGATCLAILYNKGVETGKVSGGVATGSLSLSTYMGHNSIAYTAP